jgi:hypothetical protein
LSKKILQILSQRDLPLEHLQLGLLSDVCSKSFCSGVQVFLHQLHSRSAAALLLMRSQILGPKEISSLHQLAS